MVKSDEVDGICDGLKKETIFQGVLNMTTTKYWGVDPSHSPVHRIMPRKSPKATNESVRKSQQMLELNLLPSVVKTLHQNCNLTNTHS